MAFRKGDRVEVTRNDYAEPGERTFVGETGSVTGTMPGNGGPIAAVHLDGETSSLGFGAEELKRR
jgi:hypothetical protein